MIASVEGVVGAVAADSLVIEVGGIGYRVFAAPVRDRAAVAPITRGATGYERAVQTAIAAERAASKRSAS